MVERGAGGGGRFGSQDGYPSEDESWGRDRGDDDGSVPAWLLFPALRSNSTGDELRRDERFGVVGGSSCVRDISVSYRGHAKRNSVRVE